MKKLTIILLSLLLLTNTSYSQNNLLKSGNNLIKVGNNLIGIPFNQYSMLFDGVDGQISFGDISELDGVTNFTITGWAKQPVLDVESGIWQKWLDTDNRITMVTWSDGKMYVEFGTTNGNFDY